VDDMNMSPFLIPVAAIVGAFVYAIVKTLAHARLRELEIRERIAMIERGLVPAPEVDPRGFDRAMSRLERQERLRSWAGGRHRRAGVTLMGVGFGMMVLIAFTAGDESVAIGVGGFLVLVGLAFFVNSYIDGIANGPASDPRSWGAPPPPPTSTPPSTEPPRPTNG